MQPQLRKPQLLVFASFFSQNNEEIISNEVDLLKILKTLGGKKFTIPR